MANISSLTAREALKEPLPDLPGKGSFRASRAVMLVVFAIFRAYPAAMPNFEAEIINSFNSQTWSQQMMS
ncbi:uncharacterized protein N7482_007867 [Penicillium canariense]|uniref:Uncharacterized protein n=1 Tax=Penicillium canariense TaxID=189055 RepID=A0A9W9LKQ0_9EURO|nr:uncharacterized protein N7482_007867 [Penicillium canariense]KAJ5160863.1 hypothetical protein N7482_007867 [Penicillium canariense]